MASSKETYCLCGQPYNIGQFMIECDCCREWFHGSCVDVKIYHSDDIDKYHCPKCAQTYGPSVLKIPTNNHRADRYEIGAETRPSQAGTPAWVRALAARPLRPTSAALQRMRPQHFTEEFVRDNGFTRPVIFNTTEGLDMKIPNPATFNVRSVLRYCGAQLEVEVIDVRKQTTLRMPLADFVDYFETPPEHRDDKVLNVLSLEFTDTNMCSLVEPPGIARRLDWAQSVWPGSGEPARPAVQRYCLMSARASYTDFHVDFGGTTVWYHLLHGRKIFYLIPPTTTNLALYQQWSAANNQSERFFGDMVEWYGTAELGPGETLFIPTGWIHAVYTPCDSLVFGGNLLHSYAIEMQLQIYEIEGRVETPMMFRYPLFEALHWYAAAQLLTTLRRHNEETQDEDFTISESVVSTPPAELPPLLLRGIKILANALKEWHALKSTDSSKRDNVPKCLNSGQLVRELCKELRTLEKRSSSTKDKDVKVKNHSPNKSQGKKQATPKKSLKLTLPKPIMHMQPNANGEFEEKVYADKFYIDNKEVVYPERYIQDVKYVASDVKYVKYLDQGVKYVDNSVKYVDSAVKFIDSGVKYVDNGVKYVDSGVKYVDANIKFVDDGIKYVEGDVKVVTDNVKYVNGVPDVKYGLEKDFSEKYAYQNYEEVTYQDGNGYVDRQDKKAALKIKLSNSPSSSREEPPPYSLPEHSILKSHLIRTERALKPLQQWTISKKDIGDYHEEQVLFTNENLPANIRPEGQEMNYGAGMYSAEDMQQEYQYGDTARAGYQQIYQQAELAYSEPAYQRYPEVEHQQAASYSGNAAYAHTQLPSYDAAVAHQYQTTNYVVEEQKPIVPPPPTNVSPLPVRRSERPVRRRVSSTYEYEDADLYIDETPPPTRRRAAKPKHQRHHAHRNTGKQKPIVPPPPTNVSPLPVRRSERPVRRRVSSTYEYEDADLYIDETPPPTRRRAAKPKHQRHHAHRNTGKQKPIVPPPPTNVSPLPVRRSERPVRRRVSSTYEYEDADLYIDETPPPTRRRAAKPKHQRHHAHRNTGKQKPIVPPPPTNVSPLPVRRSERPVRRRVSSTYEYEDADLYIDETPPPTRRRAAKPKHQRHHAHRNTGKQKPIVPPSPTNVSPLPVRRSERPVRRRVSSTYEYEDADLYIDETPPPTRRRAAKPKHQRHHAHRNTGKQKPIVPPPPTNVSPLPVRRSERPVRRRVSSTYEYEDADLYIDETPPPTRRRAAKPKHQRHHAHRNTGKQKPIVPPPPTNVSPLPVRRSERPVRRRVSSTYEYEDADLYIDETPPPTRRRAAKPKHQRHHAHRNTTSNSSTYRQQQQQQQQQAAQQQTQQPPPAARPVPTNGIESLIQASVLAEDQPVNDTEDAAVAGMLSISEQRYEAPPRTFGLAIEAPQRTTDTSRVESSSSGGRSRSRKAASSADDDDYDEEDVIKEVHRDEEYVYPSLEMSSDEDEDWSVRRRRAPRSRTDSRSKTDKDESWSPRARLGRVVPRLRGPARSAVRRECVRAALHAAALSHAHDKHAAHPAHAAHAAHPAHDKHHPQSAKRAVLATKSKRPPPPAPTPATSKNMRLKKGMKTAKQRLGKILKIHKMIY